MKFKHPAILLLTALAGLAPLQGNAKKPSLPEVFETARTVYVECPDGDITSMKLDREDRNAILDLQDGIEDWARYTLSRSRLDADLILVVRKGRVWRDQPNSTSLPGSGTPIGHTPIQNPADASRGPNDSTSQDGFRREKDQLSVYTLQSNGKLKGPIWNDEMDRGLQSPSILLLQRLKAQVEKAYPSTPAKKRSTP